MGYQLTEAALVSAMETASSMEGRDLVEVIQSNTVVWPGKLTMLIQYEDNLTVVQRVTMYKDRPIIPPSLRADVQDTLHSGHQGVTGMSARAANSIWWPGMTDDIKIRRANCRVCDINTPSYVNEPLALLPGLQYPFQQICLDYFTLEARPFLVLIDRYSSRPSVWHPKKGDAGEPIKFLRTHCETSGAPEGLTSDVGPQYISAELQTFLQTWSIEHRLSSA